MIRTLFWLALLGVVLYILFQYGAPQVRAWRYRDAMEQTAKFSGDTSDEDVRAELLATAEDMEIPLHERRLSIRRSRGRMHVAASWEEIVRVRGGLLGDWVDTLHYVYEVDEPIRIARMR